jgi:hypothetical protein
MNYMSEYKPGDRVRIRPRVPYYQNMTGTVNHVSMPDISIELDGIYGGPIFFYPEELEPIGNTATNYLFRCECGSDSVGAERHSNYCPKSVGF